MISQGVNWPWTVIFCPEGNPKTQIQRWRKIINSRVQLTLRYYFLPLVKVTKDLGPDEEVMFQVFRRLCKIKFWHSTQPKIRFGADTESDVWKISYPLYLIMYFLTNSKLFLREVEKGFSSFRLPLFIHILPSRNPNIRIVRGREKNFSGVPHFMQSIFLPSWSIEMKLIWLRVREYSESRLAFQTHFVPLADR
jgi:hypothetical protein